MAFNPGNTNSSSPITGLPKGGDGNPLLRKELREFVKNKDLFNLYLLGLWAWQKVPQDQDLSWFQICGIHGQPYTKWPQNDLLLEKIKKAQTGFCTHSSILFLTWHRPYLALFESTLYSAMKYVADQATEEEGRGRYLKALERFRMPYWDWALPATKETPVFPAETSDSDKVKLPMPAKMQRAYNLTSQNSLVEVHNPLFCYPFAKDTPARFLVDGRQATQRYSETPEPTPEQRAKNFRKYLHPYSQDWRETLGETPVERNLRERVVYLLQSYDNFAYVSHNRWTKHPIKPIYPGDDTPTTPGLGFGSFEDIHNALHVACGGATPAFKGHMKQVPISAFDPIFWLHHTNIDRLFTIWQALHDDPKIPDTYVTERPATNATWVTAQDDPENAGTLLAPFYQAKDTFWDSEGVRSADTFGYAYPETQHWKYKKIREYRENIMAQLNALYPNGSLGNTISALKAGSEKAVTLERAMKKRASTLASVINTESVPNDTATLLTVLHQQAVTANSASAQPLQNILAALPDAQQPMPLPIYDVPSDLTLTSLAENNVYLEWLVSIKAEKHAMDGQYSVHVFLDNVEETFTNLWMVAPNHVGTFFPLGQDAETGCGKCKDEQADHTEISGQIPLTVALAERYLAGRVASLKPNDIVPYLQQNLHWRVLNTSGQILEQRSDLPGLLVGVISNEVQLPERENERPTYSPNITHYPQITTRANGQGRGEGTGMTSGDLFFELMGQT